MEDWHGGLRLWSIYLQVQLVKDLVCVDRLTEVSIMVGGGKGVFLMEDLHGGLILWSIYRSAGPVGSGSHLCG